MANQKLSVNDPEFVDKISKNRIFNDFQFFILIFKSLVYEVKSSGHFDTFRKECLSDVDINPAYQNLHSRVGKKFNFVV